MEVSLLKKYKNRCQRVHKLITCVAQHYNIIVALLCILLINTISNSTTLYWQSWPLSSPAPLQLKSAAAFPCHHQVTLSPAVLVGAFTFFDVSRMIL